MGWEAGTVPGGEGPGFITLPSRPGKLRAVVGWTPGGKAICSRDDSRSLSGVLFQGALCWCHMPVLLGPDAPIACVPGSWPAVLKLDCAGWQLLRPAAGI